MVSMYTGEFLLGLEQATQLISTATKQPLKYARTEIAQAGSSEKFRLYDRWGKSNSLQWTSTVYKFDEVNGVEVVTFRDHYFVDLGELMDGMQFHKNTQDRIIEAHKAAAVVLLLPVQDATPAPTQEAETPAPVVVSGEPAKRKNRKPSWVVEAMPYMKRLYDSGTYRSNSVFYKALKNRVNDDDSPFTLVKGELYCDKAGTTVAEGTLGNAWKTVRGAP